MDIPGLERRLASVLSSPGAPLSSLVAIGVKEGSVAFEGAWGRRFISSEGRDRDLPATTDTKFRVASISKTTVALMAMRLVEKGLLDIHRDLSDYLGWELRNPAWPTMPITAELLFSHTSSLRDREAYNLPLHRRIEEFFSPGSEAWNESMHFAKSDSGRDLSPGKHYSYCNLGYGLMATVFERITGRRFDLLMREELFEPLGIDVSFNVNLLSDSSFANLAPLYRRADAEGNWNPDGPWTAQVDDYRGLRPACPCRLGPGLGPAALDAYELGTNGTLFSPQGGLRASIRDLGRLVRLFVGGGEIDGKRLLSAVSVAEMMQPRWSWDSSRRNGDLEGKPSRESGFGLFHGTNGSDSEGSDRILPGGGPRFWGHYADAYGLLGGLCFDPECRSGYAFLLGGTSRDPEGYKGEYSSWYRWEEEVQRALVEELDLAP